MATDLVCRREVDDSEARYFTEYDNDKYFFCSPQCKRAFDDHPDNYIQQQAREQLGQ